VSTATSTALALKADLASPTFTGNVSIGGDLSVTGFYARKPWVGYRVTTSAGVASLTDAMGFKTTGVSVAHTSGANPYTVTIPAHVAGTAYQVVVQVFTNTSNTGTVAIPTVKIISDTQFIVWLRGAFGTAAQASLVEGDFYFHTVP
jgi:phosphoribosylformylglycinamidine (FGAM) synthase-like enzyme